MYVIACGRVPYTAGFGIGVVSERGWENCLLNTRALVRSKEIVDNGNYHRTHIFSTI